MRANEKIDSVSDTKTAIEISENLPKDQEKAKQYKEDLLLFLKAQKKMQEGVLDEARDLYLESSKNKFLKQVSINQLFRMLFVNEKYLDVFKIYNEDKSLENAPFAKLYFALSMKKYGVEKGKNADKYFEDLKKLFGEIWLENITSIEDLSDIAFEEYFSLLSKQDKENFIKSLNSKQLEDLKQEAFSQIEDVLDNKIVFNQKALEYLRKKYFLSKLNEENFEIEKELLGFSSLFLLIENAKNLSDKESIKILTQAVLTYNQSEFAPKANILLGNISLKDNDFKNALRFYENAKNLAQPYSDDYFYAQIHIADLPRLYNDYKTALDNLIKLANDPLFTGDKAYVLYKIALTYLADKQYLNAHSYFERIYVLYPNKKDLVVLALYYDAVCMVNLKKYTFAKNILDLFFKEKAAKENSFIYDKALSMYKKLENF